MIIERLSQEHRNIEKLLAILERELEVFDRSDRPDYKIIRAVISYFELSCCRFDGRLVKLIPPCVRTQQG